MSPLLIVTNDNIGRARANYVKFTSGKTTLVQKDSSKGNFYNNRSAKHLGSISFHIGEYSVFQTKCSSLSSSLTKKDNNWRINEQNYTDSLVQLSLLITKKFKNIRKFITLSKPYFSRIFSQRRL